MVTLIDRIFRRPFKMAKYTGEHSFNHSVKHLGKTIPVKVTWYYHHKINTFDIVTVCAVGSSKDIWDEIGSKGNIKATIQENFISKWSDEAGIAHQYNHDVLFNPINKKW